MRLKTKVPFSTSPHPGNEKIANGAISIVGENMRSSTPITTVPKQKPIQAIVSAIPVPINDNPIRINISPFNLCMVIGSILCYSNLIKIIQFHTEIQHNLSPN